MSTTSKLRQSSNASATGTADLNEKLTPMQYEVTQKNGTEPPFRNAYWDNKRDGLYVDVVSGEVLFSSRDKFDSGTGWPSFTRPLRADALKEKSDMSHGMRRVEVRSSQADSHLGHVFQDGPGPEGTRYCINSASLRFVPVDRLQDEGYGEYLSHFGREAAPSQAGNAAGGDATKASNAVSPSNHAGVSDKAETQTALLAGGCFWGVEDILRKLPGVIDTEVGYTGGQATDPSYETVKTGRSGHAEAVQVVFDPSKLSYADLLRTFFRLHDPTTENRQGNDLGTQYRSAIFVADENQRKTAEQVRAEVNKSGKWKKPLVTEIVDASTFFPAEGYHQDYLVRNPNGYTCHWLRD